MGLYNFKKQFEAPILAGAKRHTIRAERAHSDRPGDVMHLYTGLRQRGARLLFRAPCVRVEDVSIEGGWDGVSGDFLGEVRVNGIRLDRDELEQLAKCDGFGSHAEMMEFWRGRLPFTGKIFHWDFARRWGMQAEAINA